MLLAHGGQADVDALFDEYGRPNVVDMLETLIVQAAGTGHPVDQAFVLPPIDSTASCLLDLVSFTRQVYRAVADSNLKTAEEWKHDALAALERVLDVHGADEALAPLAPETERRLLDADPQQALAAARLFPKLPGRGKVFKELTLEGTDLTAPAALASCVARLRLATARPHLDLLVRLAGEASDRFARMKAQRGVLDNDDLLTLTGRAFRDPANTALREAYRNRFALVMVDEFQDTNQMQVDMINLVAGGADGHLSPRMCVVGDAQQSIYRFRNADLRVFKDYVAQVSAAQQDGCGRIVQLEQNFRSNGEVLAFCKGVPRTRSTWAGLFWSCSTAATRTGCARRRASAVRAAPRRADPRSAAPCERASSRRAPVPTSPRCHRAPDRPRPGPAARCRAHRPARWPSCWAA